MPYDILLKLDTTEVLVEKGIEKQAAAYKLAEEYGTGKQAAYTDYSRQPGHPERIFYPTHRISSVLVIYKEPKEDSANAANSR